MEVKEVTLAVADDDDGSGAALRGWLMSAGPEAPWIVQPEAPSAGMGLGDVIALNLSSAVAALTLYDRVRQWIASRGQRAKPVTITVLVEVQGVRDTYIFTLDPKALEDGNGRAA